jgi:thiamine-monophosphate kinase
VPLAEKALITRIRRRAVAGGSTVAGIGDDCAVLRAPPGHELLVTTDFTLEGIHFRRDWQPPEAVGHQCLLRGLSDIAAMGGSPNAAFLSLALPRGLSQGWVDRFFRGLFQLAERHNVSLAGGDTAESPSGILADIVVLGSAPKGRAVRRSGAKPGDVIYVTGALGGPAAAVERLRGNPNRKLNPRDYPRYFFPEPRLEAGRILGEKGLASAMIDVSDGLSTDLAHICEESGVGAELHTEAIPRAAVGRPTHQVGLDLALHGGEDYELLFTAPPKKQIPARIAGIPISPIGHVTRKHAMLLISEEGAREKLAPLGWEHFRR